MGCWNNTCAITKLPIVCGDPVVAVLLIKRGPGCTERLNGPYSYHLPVPFYWEGEYNDYGAVENEHGAMLGPILEHVKKYLVEYEQGDNPYHDIPVKKEGFDHEALMNADHEDRLFVKINTMFKRDADAFELKHVQIRKDVFDDIIERYSWEFYNYNTESGQGGRSIRSYADIVDSYPATYTALMTNERIFHRHAPNSHLLGTLAIKFLIAEREGRNYFNNIMEVSNYLVDIAEESLTFEEFTEVVDNAVKLEIVNRFLAAAGQQWVIPGHLGQDGETEMMTHLANITIATSEKINNRWGDED